MKVKSILAALLLMVAGSQTADAQGFRVYKSDGTVVQFSLRTDSIVFYDGIGSDEEFGPFTPVNQCIVGTWYKSKSEVVSFNEDGTTDYIEGATYEFMLYQGSVIIYNASGAPTSILKIYKVSKEKMIVSSPDGNNISVWSNTQPIQLVTEIVLSETSLSLQPDNIVTLTATVLPEDADNPAVAWESSDDNVAEVNERGRVIANGIGTCVITCRATDGSGVKAECVVSVTNVQLVTGITLSQTSLSFTLPTNTTKTLTATIQPADATNKSIIWSSSKTNIATVDQTGKVTANAPGSCVITATAADGSGIKAECNVTVIQHVTKITLNQTSLTLFSGMTHELTATIMPANANNKKVTWSSNKTSVATVDQTGKVTAVAIGSCTITATAADGSGVKGSCIVTVEHEWVDLGLPSGTLWATCNVGANSPEEYGDYFAWGEIAPKSEYNWGTYKWMNSDQSTWEQINKYTRADGKTEACWYYIGAFIGDGITELLPEDDAATTNWGDGWQMPSADQLNELNNTSYTTIEWITLSGGIKGRVIFSNKNGNRIFLPAAGECSGSSSENVGWDGNYWSRSLSPESYNAFYFKFNSSSVSWWNFYRMYGRSVRPVRKQ